jgi:hypothetical protein
MEEFKKKQSLIPKNMRFMGFQDDYDSQPEEDLDITPEWMKERDVVEQELENTIEKPPIDPWKLMRGQTRGKASMFSKTV